MILMLKDSIMCFFYLIHRLCISINTKCLDYSLFYLFSINIGDHKNIATITVKKYVSYIDTYYSIIYQ